MLKLSKHAKISNSIQKHDKDCGKDEALSMMSRVNGMTREFDDLKQGLPKKPGCVKLWLICFIILCYI